jgi:hypothetical protein
LTNEHSIPLPGQKNNIVFEPIIEPIIEEKL